MESEAESLATFYPKLRAAGCSDAQVTRKHYFQRDHE
ncbi:MAG: hypothetical protein KatS3mg008_2158 [Acidimicrobiales bacterium]|nr:MAG: hypothetical protein KatS3mg008_2158 [Acidimicrobiales bacterium]